MVGDPGSHHAGADRIVGEHPFQGVGVLPGGCDAPGAGGNGRYGSVHARPSPGVLATAEVASSRGSAPKSTSAVSSLPDSAVTRQPMSDLAQRFAAACGQIASAR